MKVYIPEPIKNQIVDLLKAYYKDNIECARQEFENRKVVQMDGIKILNTIYVQNIPGWVTVILFFGIIFFLALSFIAVLNEHDKTSGIAIILCALLFIAFIIISFIKLDTNIVDKYEVTISDDVKLNEFNQKYKIVEQRGNIYTIKERE